MEERRGVCTQPHGKNAISCPIISGGGNLRAKKKRKKKIGVGEISKFPGLVDKNSQNWDWLTYGDYRVYEFTKKKIFGKLVNFLINLLKFFFFDVVGEIYFNFFVTVV